jgi:hypothetical protein
MVQHRGNKKVERGPQTLVLDASATAKWVLDEEDTEKALTLHDAHHNSRLGTEKAGKNPVNDES